MLDKLGIDWKLLLFQIVNFLLLLFILKKVLYKPILNFLENRRKRIEQGLEKAERFEAEWQKIKDIEKEKMSEVEKTAAQMLEKARLDAEKKERAILEIAHEKSGKIIEEAKKDIIQEKEKAIEELKKETADFIVIATEKILKRSVRNEDEKGLVRETIESLRKKP